MSDHDELTALREEVAALREEVRILRASQPVYYYPAGPAPGCAGGYAPYIVNVGRPDQMVYDMARMTAAGCAAQPQVLTFSRPIIA